ncbi:MAG: hypothetical protein GX310_11595 [Synergistaceae bacterium]|nr:hypothetical protein [Synergistaceae bacterium]
MEKAVKTAMAALTFLLLFTLEAGPLFANSPDPCELFPQGEAEALMGMEAASARQSGAVSPAGRVCTYFFKKDGGTFDAKLRIGSDGEIAAEGIFDSAADAFTRQVEARKKHEYASAKYRELETPGAEAFWNGVSVWALKDGLLLIITVNPPLGGTFASMDEATAAKEEKSLDFSLKILESALGKLP